MALQSLPINLSPEFVTLDATADILFQWTPVGAPQTRFRLLIYDITTGSTLTYDSTVVVSTDTFLLVPGATMVNDKTYTWVVLVYRDAVNYVTSEWIIITTAIAPTVTVSFDSVTDQVYLFTGNYTVATNTTLQKFVFDLYDATNVLIDTSGVVYSATCQYGFSGLSNGVSYSLICTVTDQNNQTTISSPFAFVPSFSIPNTMSVVEVTVVDESAYNTIEWVAMLVVTGVLTGSGQYL